MSSAVLIGIVFSLLLFNYKTQQRLQKAAVSRSEENLESQAKAVEYFISERRNDLRGLATGDMVSAFFTNKALGMSMEYGLKGSLDNIRKQFSHLNEATRLEEEPIYTRLVLFSPEGEILAEYQSISPCPIQNYNWQAIAAIASQDTGVVEDKDNPSFLLFTAPVRRHDQIQGFVVGWVSLKVIHNKFLKASRMAPGRDPQSIDTIILAIGKSGWYADNQVDAKLRQEIQRLAPAARGKSVSRSEDTRPQDAPGWQTEAHLVTWNDADSDKRLILITAQLPAKGIRLFQVMEQKDIIDPHGLLNLLIMLAFISLGGIGITLLAFRHSTRAQVLAAKLHESGQKQAEIKRSNEMLTLEIEQRQKAERELAKEKTLLRSLIAAIPDPVYYKDLESRYLGCNAAYERIFGVKESDIVHKRADDIFDANAAAVIQQQDEAVLTSGQTLQFERWIENPGSQRLLLETKKTPYYSGEGEMIGLIGVTRDITSRKNMELALEEQRQRLQLVIDATNTGVWEWNVQTGETIFNERWAGIVGYTLEELSPVSIQTWIDLCHPDDLEQSNKMLEKHFAGETDYYECECRLRHKDGHWVWTHDSGRVVQWTADGRPLHMSGTHTDITARKQAEEQLRLANETLERRVLERTQALQETHSKMAMQEKMASIGQIAAGIAHELNNPIHFIRTNSASLTQEFTDLVEMLQDYRKLIAGLEADGRWSQDLEAVRAKEAALQIDAILDDIPALFVESERGFGRIMRIIQSMRNFSHVNFQDNRSFFNINRGIEDTLVIAHNVYKYHVEISTDLGELPQIRCSPEQLNQVFLNLIVNSSQAIESQNRQEKGLIAIRTWYEAEAVYCEISDNGPGIPEDIRSRIFEPFFTTKEPGKGTGLGLSISYDIIVNKHHGDLTVHCPKSGGAVFTIRIPANLPAFETDDETCQ